MHLDSTIRDFIANSLKWNTGFITRISKLNGFNNSNYKLNYLGMDYFLSLKGDQFCKECLPFYKEVLENTSKKGISYNIVHLNETTGDLMTHWIDGDTPDYETLNSPQFISSLCTSLKKFHSIEVLRVKDPFESIINKYTQCLDKNLSFPIDIIPLLNKAQDISIKYENNKLIGLCHYDLNPSNIIFNNNISYLIDLEFSAMGDVFWDLATISWMMDEHSRLLLLDTYFGEHSPSLLEKLNDYLYQVKLWNALWSLLKSTEPYCPYDYAKGAEIILKELIDQ